MTANTPLRAATAGDLINYRSGNQAVKFGIAIHKPSTVYTAQINQTFSSYDNIIQIEYDNGSGTLADVLDGMTMYIGSSAGARDKGIVRIRTLPTENVFYIGATSDIQFAENDHLTIVNEFSIWGKEIDQNGDVIKMDSDMLYASRPAMAIIRAAPMVAVIKRTLGTATFTPPSPALSSCYDGATITGWQYSAPGAASTSNMTSGTGTASWTYTSAGQYRWSLTVTDSNGRTATTYRWIFVNPVSPDFVISSNPSADGSEGGWSFGITMYDNAATSDIVDRAMITLYTEVEYFNGVEAVIGKLAGFENIVTTGWIDGETIVRDSQQGTVSFMVHGAAHWMNKVRSSAVAIENVPSVDAWGEILDMTVDKALAYILSNMSTVTTVMDCFFSGSETLIDILAQPSGSLWSQITAAAVNTIFAEPLVNSLGQLFIEINPQMMTSTQKASLTTVMTITSQDWEGELDIDRLTSGETAMIELQCNTYDGSLVSPVYSRAPGNIGKNYGDINAPTNYYADDQNECNRLAGALLAISNPLYSPLEITLAHQNRLIDICPSQYCQISIAAGDTLRGITLTNQKLIARRISLDLQDDGYYKTSCEFELATSPIDGISYYPPQPQDETDVSDSYDPFDLGGIGAFPSPTIDFPPSLPSLTLGTPPNCKTSTSYLSAPKNSFSLAWSKNTLLSTDSDRIAKAYFPCSIRISTADNPTYMIVGGTFTNCVSGLTLYGVAGGSRVITATGGVVKAYQQNAVFIFSPVSAVDVDGFELEIDAGSGYTAGDIIDTGSVNATNVAGVNVSVVEGNLYSIEGANTYWLYQTVFPSIKFYNFWRGAGHPDGGGVGYTPTLYGGGGMSLEIPSGCLFTEAVDSLYARTYFIADATEVFNFCVSDTIFGDNGGSLGYILREASAELRTAALGGIILKNVCAV